jgi:hypothetical protein
MRSPYPTKPKVKPIALVMSDLHLSHKPPVWRSSEKDWYTAMRRSFTEIANLQENLQTFEDTKVPILIAGDIFHKWNSPPSLINFAIDVIGQFGKVIAIPGQHDLPNHLDSQLEASPYQTLVKAGSIIDIDDSEWETDDEVVVRGYGWNTGTTDIKCHMALVHRYVWMDGCSYHGAPNTNKVGELAHSLGKPKLIVTGDNHIGFWHQKTRIFNCGSLFRLNKDQQMYRPRIGVVYSDMSILPYYLDTSNDNTLGRFADSDVMDIAEKQDDIDDFIQELGQMGRGGLDYLDAVRRYTNKHGVRKATAKLIESILTGG